MNNNDLAVWAASDQVTIPASIKSVQDIVNYATATLSKRDIKSIVSGFESGSFEMVSTFVWSKATATLKQQVSTLGMEFVGEMLGRPDLDADSDPASSIADHEAIRLAELLGMITATQAMRLKHAMQIVAHFSKKQLGDGDDEEMNEDEVRSLLRACVSSILGKPHFDAAVRFVDFRKRLNEQTFHKDDPIVDQIKNSPHFFQKTTLSVLLSAVKTSKGALLENVLGNIMSLVPAMWPTLREPEKWQVGQAYAEANSNNSQMASAALRRALMDVRGFDFVPESLRSSTYTQVAAKVLEAHFGYNNFYNEQEPAAALAMLGTTVPMPAFAKCMEATLAVRLGNRWGFAWAAQGSADQILRSLRDAQWQYYLNECLPSDVTVLDKVSQEDAPRARWCLMVQELVPSGVIYRNSTVGKLIDASRANVVVEVTKFSAKLRGMIGQKS